MSVSFLDSNSIKKFREDILKLNIKTSFDASYIGYGTSVLTDRGKFTSVNNLNPNIINEPRPSDLQEPLSISLLRLNKYGSTEDGYYEVNINNNFNAFLGNTQKLEYDELVEPFKGIPISDNVSSILDVKTLILNNNISSYKDTPIGLIGIRSLKELLNENISSSIQNSSINRFNTDPLSLLKGNNLIVPSRGITTVNPTDATQLTDPTLFLKAGVELSNRYLGINQAISLIPNSAVGIYEDFESFSMKKRKVKGFKDSNKITNLLNNINETTNKIKNGIENTLAKLGVGNPNDLSTESRMEELLNFTSSGQREFMVDNLSNNIYQPGYSYSQGLLRVKKLANFQANTIKNNVINRGTKGVYGLNDNNTKRYNKFGTKGAQTIKDNDKKSVLKSNGMVRITPEVDSNGKPIDDFKSYMFSIENLAWADVPSAFMSEGERGYGDRTSGLVGKMMWFPPYDLKVSDESTANWDEENFLGRPEPVYTYNNSSRSGSLSFKLVVDHPSIINLARGNQSDILERYFNGEFDIEDFDKYLSGKNTEDQNREYKKKLFGFIKRKKINESDNKDINKEPVSAGVTSSNMVKDINRLPKTDETIKSLELPPKYWSDVENSWFKKIDLEDDITYKYLAEKIQHFHPGFHSTSPEGFNARLTFLQQCLRQGPSLSEGNKSYSGNLSFGRPPVSILRVGDFYYTKVIFTSLSISFDESSWDLNPDGIGVQPMVANVSLNFNYIGGSSLTGPVNRLQNSLSFNYYANTGIYEQRSLILDPTTNKYKSLVDMENKKTNNEGDKGKPSSDSGNQVVQQNENQIQNSGGQKNKKDVYVLPKTQSSF